MSDETTIIPPGALLLRLRTSEAQAAVTDLLDRLRDLRGPSLAIGDILLPDEAESLSDDDRWPQTSGSTNATVNRLYVEVGLSLRLAHRNLVALLHVASGECDCCIEQACTDHTGAAAGTLAGLTDALRRVLRDGKGGRG